MKRTTWDEMYMSMCYLVAQRSRDVNTHVGSVIAGTDNVIKSIGYNSLPRNIESEGPEGDDGVPARQSRINGEKYHWFEHAERNALYNALRNGVLVNDCKMYITWAPCTECARGIIQSGISEVIIHKQGQEAYQISADNGEHKWTDDHDRSILMMEEAGLKVRWYSGPIQKGLTGYFSGKDYAFNGPRFHAFAGRLRK